MTIPVETLPARGDGFTQFVLPGLVLSVGGTIMNGLVGGFAGTISRGLTQRPSLSAWLQRITGALLLGLAARIAFDRH